MKKTLTCNISGSESYGHSTEISPELSHIPAEIAKKYSASLDNPTWNTYMDNYNTTPIACNISQTQY